MTRPSRNIVSRIRVLVIDSDLGMRRLLRRRLPEDAFELLEAGSGYAALALLAAADPEVVLMELLLPDMDGFDLLGELSRRSRLPIVILSNRDDEASKIRAFELGADDFVVKPFAAGELAARLRVAIRHGFQQRSEEAIFRSGDLVIDLVRHWIVRGDTEIRLAGNEFALIAALARHPGRVVAHDRLLSAMHRPDTDFQYLRNCVSGIRRKIEPEPAHPTHLLTVARAGYRLR